MFFVIQHFISGFKPAATTPLVDADVASAVGALATSLETSARGVIYEQPSQSSLAEDLRRGLKTLIAEIGRGGGTRFETEVAIVLRGIERAASHQVKEIGAGPRDYLKLASRLVHPQIAGTESPSLIIRP